MNPTIHGIREAKEYLKAAGYKKAMVYLQSLGIPLAEAEAHLEQWDRQIWTGLKHFVIKVGGECVNGKESPLSEQIAVLNQLGTYPIVVHGGGPQIDALMKAKGLPIKKKNGQRITDKETLECVIEALAGINSKLVSEINQYGGEAQSLADTVYAAQLDKELGFVGKPIGVNERSIDEFVNNRKSPVLWCIGYDESQQAYNINADRVATALIKYMGPEKFAKLIWVTPTGGVLDKSGQLISSVNHSEISKLIEDGIITDGMAEKLSQAKELFDDKSLTLDYRFKIQIVSPSQLLCELLTKKGAGTEVVRS